MAKKNDSFDNLNNDSFDNLNNDSFNDEGSSYDSDWKPQEMGYDTFKLRNDPSILLKEIKYYLMQVEEVVDENNPSKIVIRRKRNPFKNTELVTPMVNQQGVEELMMCLKPLINNHNVMGNTSSESYHIRRMNFIGGDLIILCWSKREKWSLDRDNVNPIIYFIVHQIDLFLTRTIADAERRHYGESFKETREVKPMTQERRNILDRFVPSVFRG